MDFKTSLIIFIPLAILSLFVPIMNNPAPKDCNNYPDGSGGYYSKCKDEYVSLITKWKIERELKKAGTDNSDNELRRTL